MRLRCIKCFKKNSGLAHHVPNGVEASCTDKARLIERDNDDFESDVDLVFDAGQRYANGTIVVEELLVFAVVASTVCERRTAVLMHSVFPLQPHRKRNVLCLCLRQGKPPIDYYCLRQGCERQAAD